MEFIKNVLSIDVDRKQLNNKVKDKKKDIETKSW